jgi:hypothetical protein
MGSVMPRRLDSAANRWFRTKLLLVGTLVHCGLCRPSCSSGVGDCSAEFNSVAITKLLTGQAILAQYRERFSELPEA